MKWIWYCSLNYSKIRGYKDLDSGFKKYCSQKLIIIIFIMIVIKNVYFNGIRVFFKFHGRKYSITVKMSMSDFWKKEFREMKDYYYTFRLYAICKSLIWEPNDILPL